MQRAIFAYGTVPNELLVLAGTLPFSYITRVNDTVYHHIKNEKTKGITPQRSITKIWHVQEQIRAFSSWQNDLSTGKAQRKSFLNAILKHWEEWMTWGSPSHRVTQLLTGHGCFADYLRKIGATRRDTCAECGECPDSTTHTLLECKAFKPQSEELKTAIGNTHTPPHTIELSPATRRTQDVKGNRGI